MRKILYFVFCFSLFFELGANDGADSKLDSIESKKSIVISFVGDCILGDYFGSGGETFNWQFGQVKGDYSYFFKKVKSVLEADSMTLANLEGPLTTHNGDRLVKQFAFKGSPKYTQILKEGSVEAVNIANNHTRDYGLQGFKDTQAALKNAGIYFSGEGVTSIYEVNGIKIGMAGHRGWSLDVKSKVKSEIEQLRKNGADIVIFTFHWGEERQHYPNATQKALGRFAIDSGADIVIGHHPHVLQGIEEYKGKKIVYSLANFVYGGAKNPRDRDTIIYQVKFDFNGSNSSESKLDSNGVYLQNKNVKKVAKMPRWSETHSFIPVLISSEKSRNNYQPMIAKDADKTRIINRMEEYSKNLSK